MGVGLSWPVDVHGEYGKVGLESVNGGMSKGEMSLLSLNLE